LSKRGFEIAVEGILDVLFIQTAFLVNFSARRGGHGWMEKSSIVVLGAQSA
jgi:hypothetical protein